MTQPVMCRWNIFSCKTITYLFYKVSTMGADVLAMQGAGPSATMILTILNRINLVPHVKGLYIEIWVWLPRHLSVIHVYSTWKETILWTIYFQTIYKQNTQVSQLYKPEQCNISNHIDRTDTYSVTNYMYTYWFVHSSGNWRRWR